MPIYEYTCIKCGHTFERLVSPVDTIKVVECKQCGGWCQKRPSIPGFRRDHTIVEKNK
jgi:putative FmdB family regulatory protein